MKFTYDKPNREFWEGEKFGAPMPPLFENKTITQVTYPRIVIKCKFTWLRDYSYDPGQVLPSVIHPLSGSHKEVKSIHQFKILLTVSDPPENS